MKIESGLLSSIVLGLRLKTALYVTDNFGGKSLIDEMYRELHNPSFLSEEILLTSISKLLIKIIQQNQVLCTEGEVQSKVVGQAVKYITENCCDKIIVSSLAEKFHLSKYYFTHIFKSETGMSPRAFITYMRISAAYLYLTNSDLSVAEISEKCCFTSPADMARKFREEYATTPTQLRKYLILDDNKAISFFQYIYIIYRKLQTTALIKKQRPSAIM